MPDAKPSIDELKAIERLGGDRMFAFFILAVSVCLLALIFDQTQWKTGKALLSQPAFWPGLSLIGMVLCAICYLFQSLRARHYSGWERRELFVWLRCLEFPLWFMAYVFAVPYVGYLPATVVFCPLLAREWGIRIEQRSCGPRQWARLLSFFSRVFCKSECPVAPSMNTCRRAAKFHDLIFVRMR